jgi:hypothetical protein
MNAFRNDESMKHILEEQKVVKPLQTAESARNTVIAQDANRFTVASLKCFFLKLP